MTYVQITKETLAVDIFSHILQEKVVPYKALEFRQLGKLTFSHNFFGHRAFDLYGDDDRPICVVCDDGEMIIINGPGRLICVHIWDYEFVECCNFDLIENDDEDLEWEELKSVCWENVPDDHIVCIEDPRDEKSWIRVVRCGDQAFPVEPYDDEPLWPEQEQEVRSLEQCGFQDELEWLDS